MKTKDFDFIRVEDRQAEREEPERIFSDGRSKLNVLLEELLQKV